MLGIRQICYINRIPKFLLRILKVIVIKKPNRYMEHCSSVNFHLHCYFVFFRVIVSCYSSDTAIPEFSL